MPELESHDYVTMKKAGNGNFSKDLRLVILFLEGSREWTLGDRLLSFSRGNALRQMDLCFSYQTGLGTLRKASRTVGVACHLVNAHIE